MWAPFATFPGAVKQKSLLSGALLKQKKAGLRVRLFFFAVRASVNPRAGRIFPAFFSLSAL